MSLEPEEELILENTEFANLLLSSLPVKERSILHDHLIEGLTFQEIGDKMDMSPTNANQIYLNTIKLLKQRSFRHDNHPVHRV